MDDLAGGTFTISNGGVFGSMMGTPIINIPQVAILGMHAIRDRPMAINGQVGIVYPLFFPYVGCDKTAHVLGPHLRSPNN